LPSGGGPRPLLDAVRHLTRNFHAISGFAFREHLSKRARQITHSLRRNTWTPRTSPEMTLQVHLAPPGIRNSLAIKAQTFAADLR
jgi:hypothetical protein